MSNAAITNQDELRQKLAGRGFEVTQATLSRDIRDLHLVKTSTGYALPSDQEADDDVPEIARVMGAHKLSTLFFSKRATPDPVGSAAT